MEQITGWPKTVALFRMGGRQSPQQRPAALTVLGLTSLAFHSSGCAPQHKALFHSATTSTRASNCQCATATSRTTLQGDPSLEAVCASLMLQVQLAAPLSVPASSGLHPMGSAALVGQRHPRQRRLSSHTVSHTYQAGRLQSSNPDAGCPHLPSRRRDQAHTAVMRTVCLQRGKAPGLASDLAMDHTK